MKLSLAEAQRIMRENYGVLDLQDTEFTELPDNLTVEEDLWLSNKDMTSLPCGLTVKGLLVINGTGITELPRRLSVGGLWLTDSDITELPADMSFTRGILSLTNTAVTSLAGRTRWRNILLQKSRCPIALPKGLTVEDSFTSDGTGHVTLPEDMTVRGHLLMLSGSPVAELPRGLKVGGDLSLNYSLVETLPDDLVVDGSLYLSGSRVRELPRNLAVGGNLNLWNTPIRKLPEGLAVGGSLDLKGTGVEALPGDLLAGGTIFLPESMAGARPAGSFGEAKYAEGRYLYADRRLTHVCGEQQYGGYTVYIGTVPGTRVVSDGNRYARCRRVRDGIQELKFEEAKFRGAEYLKGLDLDAKMTADDLAVAIGTVMDYSPWYALNVIRAMPGGVRDGYTLRELIGEIERSKDFPHLLEKFRKTFDI